MYRILFGFFLLFLPFPLLADGSDDEAEDAATTVVRPAAAAPVVEGAPYGDFGVKDYERLRLVKEREFFTKIAPALRPGTIISINQNGRAEIQDLIKKRRLLRGIMTLQEEGIVLKQPDDLSSEMWGVLLKQAFRILDERNLIDIESLSKSIKQAYREYKGMLVEGAAYKNAQQRMDNLETFFKTRPLPLHTMSQLYHFVGSMALARRGDEDGVFPTISFGEEEESTGITITDAFYLKPKEFAPVFYEDGKRHLCARTTRLHAAVQALHSRGDALIAWAKPLLKMVKRLNAGHPADEMPTLYNSFKVMSAHVSLEALKHKVQNHGTDIDDAIAHHCAGLCLSFSAGVKKHFEGTEGHPPIDEDHKRIFMRGLSLLEANTQATADFYTAVGVPQEKWPSYYPFKLRIAIAALKAAEGDLFDYWTLFVDNRVRKSTQLTHEVTSFEEERTNPTLVFLEEQLALLEAQKQQIARAPSTSPLLEKTRGEALANLHRQIHAFKAVIAAKKSADPFEVETHDAEEAMDAGHSDGTASDTDESPTLDDNKETVMSTLKALLRDKIDRAQLMAAEHSAFSKWMAVHAANISVVEKEVERYLAAFCLREAEVPVERRMPDRIPKLTQFIPNLISTRLLAHQQNAKLGKKSHPMLQQQPLPDTAGGASARSASSGPEEAGGGGSGGGGSGGGGKPGV